MKRVIEVEMESRGTAKQVIAKFFKRHPELDYWKEQFEYMAENNKDFECDNLYADGTKNPDWIYALHLDVNEDSVYICVIERA